MIRRRKRENKTTKECWRLKKRRQVARSLDEKQRIVIEVNNESFLSVYTIEDILSTRI